MINGIGTDIVEIGRIREACEKNAFFYQRILSPAEQNIYEEDKRYSFLAGRFAAKEAIVKALGTGIGKISWQMIEILPNDLGQPQVSLFGYAKEFLNSYGGKIHLSISHERHYATAVAVWEVNDEVRSIKS